MDSEDEKGVEDKGNSLNINRCNFKLPIFFYNNLYFFEQLHMNIFVGI